MPSFLQRLRRLLGAPPRRDNLALPFRARGENIILPNSCRIGYAHHITLGSHLYFGPECAIDAAGGLTIGDNVAIGPGVRILTASHRWGEGATAIPYDTIDEKGAVTIASHVWIGGWALILPGVTLGEGCIVGAGAVVTEDVEPLAVVVGNPARVVKRRDRAEFERLRDAGKWFLKHRPGLVRGDEPPGE